MSVGLLVLGLLCFGVNTVVWGSVGALRWTVGAFSRAAGRSRRLEPEASYDRRIKRVAVLIAAHNEEAVIAKTLESARRLVTPEQIFVASDGSSDATVRIATAWGARVLDLQPNRGKAGALSAAVDHFEFYTFADYVVLLDADTELDPDYFRSALPLMDDPAVSVVAGRAATQWHPRELGWVGKVVVAHRERLYFLVQRLQKYGQAAANADVVAIAPGFASMYRTEVLASIRMDPPGLVIEDFNMTFEVHRRGLGRIAFLPSAAVAYTQDPSTLRDYRKQVVRWGQGFWQTLRLHAWSLRGRFRLAVGLYSLEVLLSSLSLLAAPLLLLGSGARAALHSLGVAAPYLDWLPSPLVLLVVVAAPDLILSLITAAAQRRISMILLAPAFLVMRVVDAWLCLAALRRAFGPPSTGVWVSPARRAESSTIPQAPVSYASDEPSCVV
jgi:cellulose synthase/poly-beta-1,6-N-acetylglucosamine synthase-like glycosyltransferase